MEGPARLMTVGRGRRSDAPEGNYCHSVSTRRHCRRRRHRRHRAQWSQIKSDWRECAEDDGPVRMSGPSWMAKRERRRWRSRRSRKVGRRRKKRRWRRSWKRRLKKRGRGAEIVKGGRGEKGQAEIVRKKRSNEKEKRSTWSNVYMFARFAASENPKQTHPPSLHAKMRMDQWGSCCLFGLDWVDTPTNTSELETKLGDQNNLCPHETDEATLENYPSVLFFHASHVLTVSLVTGWTVQAGSLRSENMVDLVGFLPNVQCGCVLSLYILRSDIHVTPLVSTLLLFIRQ